MGLLRKKSDPVSDRAQALNDEIAELEAQIKKLDTRLQRNQSHPRLRSTAAYEAYVQLFCSRRIMNSRETAPPPRAWVTMRAA